MNRGIGLFNHLRGTTLIQNQNLLNTIPTLSSSKSIFQNENTHITNNKALVQFYTISSTRKETPTEITKNFFYLLQGKARTGQFTDAQNMINIAKKPDNFSQLKDKDHLMVVKSFISLNRMEEAEQWEQNSTSEISLNKCLSFIKGYCRYKNFEKAEEWFGKIPKDLMEIRCYNIFIDYYGAEKNIEQAKNWFDKIEHDGLLPDSHSWQSLLKAYALSGLTTEVEETIKHMELYVDYPVTAVNLTNIVRAYLEAGDVRKSKLWLSEIYKLYSRKDEPQVRTPENVASRKDLPIDSNFFLKPLTELDVDAYSISIDYYLKHRKWNSALQNLKMIKRRKFKRDLNTYLPFIYAKIEDGEKMDRHDARKQIKKIQKERIFPNFSLYKYLIIEHIKKQEVGHAWNFLRKMKERGYQPTTKIYNSFIQGFCECNNEELVLNILVAMQRDSVIPDQESYDIIFNQWKGQGRTERALKWIKKKL